MGHLKDEHYKLSSYPGIVPVPTSCYGNNNIMNILIIIFHIFVNSLTSKIVNSEIINQPVPYHSLFCCNTLGTV